MTTKSIAFKKFAQLDMPSFSHQVSLSVQVADQLESLLADGYIAVGEKLPTEAELCETFSVSRTVIREAITQLKSLGLVETRRGMGTKVIRTAPAETIPAQKIMLTTVDDVLHALELRLSLEPVAAELAAQHHDDGDRHALLTKHMAFVRARHGESKARDEDYDFHYAIVTASKNPFFVLVYKQLTKNIIPRSSLVYSKTINSRMNTYLDQVEQDHTRILEAILAHDPKVARDTMFQHIARAKRMYAKYRLNSDYPDSTSAAP